MSVKLLTEHHLEFLSLKGGCTCSSESTLVRMPHCMKSHAVARMISIAIIKDQISTHGTARKRQETATHLSLCIQVTQEFVLWSKVKTQKKYGIMLISTQNSQ